MEVKTDKEDAVMVGDLEEGMYVSTDRLILEIHVSGILYLLKFLCLKASFYN